MSLLNTKTKAETNTIEDLEVIDTTDTNTTKSLNKKKKKISKIKIIIIVLISIIFGFIALCAASIAIYIYGYAPEQYETNNKTINSVVYNNISNDTIDSKESSSKETKNKAQNKTENKTVEQKDYGSHYYSNDINWKSTQKVSSDIVAWINIKNTPISYPVFYKKNDNPKDPYYLYRNYKKEYDMYGSIYVNPASKQVLKSKNIILMGHNMDDGSMFHSLTNYGGMKGNLDFYIKSPTISLKHNDKKDIYKIISVMKIDSTDKSFNSLVGEFYSSAEFMNYVYQVKARSLINTNIKVNENDSLLTLSTCSYEYENFRTVVVARKVRNGENPSVDPQNCSLNKEVLFPNICYKNDKNLKKTKITTFMTEYKKHKISWYDGNGKVSGGEKIY